MADSFAVHGTVGTSAEAEDTDAQVAALLSRRFSLSAFRVVEA